LRSNQRSGGSYAAIIYSALSFRTGKAAKGCPVRNAAESFFFANFSFLRKKRKWKVRKKRKWGAEKKKVESAEKKKVERRKWESNVLNWRYTSCKVW